MTKRGEDGVESRGLGVRVSTNSPTQTPDPKRQALNALAAGDLAWVFDARLIGLRFRAQGFYLDLIRRTATATRPGYLDPAEYEAFYRAIMPRSDRPNGQALRDLDSLFQSGVIHFEGRDLAVGAGSCHATDQYQYQRSTQQEKKDLNPQLINDQIELTAEDLHLKGEKALKEEAAMAPNGAFVPDEKPAGIERLDLAGAFKGLLREVKQGLVERIAAVCTDSFRKRGWRERIDRIQAAGLADLLIEALDYIERSRNPRVTDVEPVRDAARYMAGCIKAIEAKIAGGETVGPK